MNPAWSVVFFTVLAGFGQGLAVTLALAVLAGALAPGSSFLLWGLGCAIVLLAAGLAASFLHLGHPLRAWRAAAMWRTSWLSREVIVLPAFMGLLALWWLAVWRGGLPDVLLASVLPAAAMAGAAALWVCTAMIYACIRFIQEWAHPLTIVNYTTLGLASGLVTAGALAVLAGAGEFAGAISGWALAATAVAWFTRTLSLRRNARLKPKSTTQTATGIHAARVVQTSMGMTGGSFNTREFFHGASARAVRMARVGFQVLAFALPIVLLAWALLSGSAPAWLLALASQAAGLLAERWFFFAQAQHPQNIYYQAVS